MFQYENSDLQACVETVAQLGASMIGSEHKPGSPLEGHKAQALYLELAMHDIRNPDEYYNPARAVALQKGSIQAAVRYMRIQP